MNREICLLGFLDKGKREKIGYYLFFAGIMLELLVMVTDNAAYYTILYRGRILQVAFMLFFFKIVLTSFNLKEWILAFILCVVGTYLYLVTDDEYVIRCFVFVLACKGVELEKIIKVIFWTTIISTTIIAVLSVFDISGPLVQIRDYSRGGIEKRFSFGFNHANNIHSNLWYIITLFFLFKREMAAKKELIILCSVNLLLYFFTLSRTGFLICVILLLGIWIISIRKDRVINVLYFLMSFISLACCVFLTVWSAKYSIYRSRLEAFLDKFLTGRLEMVSEQAAIYSWTLEPTNRANPGIDNGYANIIYVYGVRFALVFVLLLVALELFFLAKKKITLQLVLMCVVIELFMESTFIISESVLCNVLVILGGLCINGKKDQTN